MKAVIFINTIICAMPAGYSGTPLVKKLGIKPGYKVLLIDSPEHYFDLLGEIPEGVDFLEKAGKEEVDFIHFFCKEKDQLAGMFKKAKKALKKDGMVWASWPKTASKKYKADFKGDLVRSTGLKIGLVDVKVCAVDADWSGHKFMYRIKDR